MPFGPVSRAAVLGLMLCVPLGLSGAAPDSRQTAQASQSTRSLTDELFAIDRPLQIALNIPEEGINELGQSRPSPTGEAKLEADATVLEGGREYPNVTVRLKGFSSFQPINARPSFTLHFDKRIADQTFHGLTKISLNN